MWAQRKGGGGEEKGEEREESEHFGADLSGSGKERRREGGKISLISRPLPFPALSAFLYPLCGLP